MCKVAELSGSGLEVRSFKNSQSISHLLRIIPKWLHSVEVPCEEINFITIYIYNKCICSELTNILLWGPAEVITEILSTDAFVLMSISDVLFR